MRGIKVFPARQNNEMIDPSKHFPASLNIGSYHSSAKQLTRNSTLQDPMIEAYQSPLPQAPLTKFEQYSAKKSDEWA
jgi:hypothetical protein